jgi:hypothetical protein
MNNSFRATYGQDRDGVWRLKIASNGWQWIHIAVPLEDANFVAKILTDPKFAAHMKNEYDKQDRLISVLKETGQL